MAHCSNEQMMEQMKSKMEEIFAQMIANINVVIDRVFNIVMSDEKTIKLVEFQSNTFLKSVHGCN